MTRALITLLAAAALFHLADRLALGWTRCGPAHHCVGGPRW